jgi:hypothetical protein
VAHLDRRVFRLTGASLVASAIFLLLTVRVAISFIHDLGNDHALAAFSGLLTGAGLFLAVRSVWMSVVAAPAGLTARNLFRTHHVLWEHIDHFEYGRKDPLPLVGIAVLRDGRRIGLSAIQPPNPLFRPRNSFARESIDALNAYRTAIVGEA